ncbi:MAG: chorismate mutase [Candidatus Bathyarchaeia archaeon]
MTYEDEIEGLRKEINRLNEEILERLAKRVQIAIEIGLVKKRYGRPIVDRAREKAVYKQVRRLAEKHNLDPEGVERVFRETVSLCTKAQVEA